MPIEIAGISNRKGWTSTSAIATHKAPFAGLGTVAPSPIKKMDGLQISVLAESNRYIPGAEFSVLFLPALKGLDLEIVGEPKLVVDDSPIWVWRKVPQEPDPGSGIRPGDYAYEAVISSGPFKGHAGIAMAPSDCTQKFDSKGNEISWKCKMGTPTVKDTAELPRYVSRWSVMLRPVTGEDLKTKRSQVSKALREPRQALQQAVGGIIGTQVKEAKVPTPKAKAGGVGASAAIIGIALAMLTWTQRRQ